MKLIVSNNIVIEDPNQRIIDYCSENLIINNPDFIMAEKLGKYTGHMEKKLYLFSVVGDTLLLPFGCLDDIWKLRDKHTTIENKINAFKGSNLVGSIKLYNYQEKACMSLKRAKNGILIAPCGSGKTQIGLELAKRIGGKTLWLTHTKKLLEQSKSRIEEYFKGDLGTITEGKVCIGNDITFATVQTMSKIDTSIYSNVFDTIIVDECHHCVGSPTKVKQFYKIVNNINCRYKYGLTATLTRSDGLIKCVFALLGKVVYTITEKEVGTKVIKAEYKVIENDIDYKMDDYVNTDGTINYNELINTLCFSEERNNIIIENVCKNKDKKQLILCARVKQVELLKQKLLERNIDTIAIHGSVKDKNRNYNHNVIVATFQLAKEGLDIPTLNILHFTAPVKDKVTVIQSAGRVERNYNGKETPIIYDYLDSNVSYCVNAWVKRKNIIKNKK